MKVADDALFWTYQRQPTEAGLSVLDRLFRNATFLLLSRITDKLSRAIVLILVTRYLEVDPFGQYSVAVHFGFLCLAFFDLGLQTCLIRAAAADRLRTPAYLVNALVLKTLHLAAALAGIGLLLWLLRYPVTTEKCIWILVASRVLASFAQLGYSVFRAHGKSEYELWASLCEALVLLACTWAITRLSGGLVWLCFAWMVSGLVGVLASLCFLHRRIVSLRTCFGQLQTSRVTGLARETTWFALNSLCSALFAYLAVPLLSKMVSMEGAGFYSAAYNLVFPLFVIPVVFVDSLFPFVSSQRNATETALSGFLFPPARYFVLGSIPVALAITSLAPAIIRLFYGERYLASQGAPGAEDALAVLIWNVGLVALTYLFGHMLFVLGKERRVALASAIGVGVNCLINVFVIPPYSFVGAAYGLVATQLVICLLLGSPLLALLPIRPMALMLSRSVLAGSVMWLVLLVIRARLGLGLSAAIGTAVYLAALWLLGAVGRGDLLRMRAAAAGLWVRT